MKNKKIALLGLLPLLMGALSGCGGNNGGGTTSETIKVKFWHTFGQTIVDGLKIKISDFATKVKTNDGVNVEIEMVYQGGYDDIAKKIADGYGVNNKPTIAVAYPDNVSDYIEIGQSAGEDFVVNLDKFINDDQVGFGKEKWLGDAYGKEDFVESFLEEGTKYSVTGTYSLPYMKSTEIMFYNLKLMRIIMPGYKPSIGNSDTAIKNYMKNLTWDEFMKLCKYVKEHMEEISNVLEVPAWYDSDGNLFITKMYQNNVPYSSVNTTTGKGAIDFANGDAYTKAKTILETLNKEFHEGLFTTKGVKNKYGSDFFTGEKCVFSIGSSGGSGYNFPEAEAFDLGVCKVPYDNNNPTYVSQGPTLAMFSDNGLSKELNEKTQLYAWKFLKYITNGQVNAELCINGSEGYIPVRLSAYETQIFQEFMEEGENYALCYQVVVDDINTEASYIVSPTFKGSATLRDECGTMLTSAIQRENKEDIETDMATCISNARQKF